MLKMGAVLDDREKAKVNFRVFAWQRRRVEVEIKLNDRVQRRPLTEEAPYLFNAMIEGLEPDLLYKFVLDGKETYPDPYSHFQPFGVHGYSQLIDHHAYRWRDAAWFGLDPEQLIIMEVHVGTCTPEGTFRALAEKLDYFLELGINALELMPVAETPGGWNWGYDGANLFSVNHHYGTPDDLKYLVDHCHRKGLAIILDVVYNHFGPEGCYLPAYGPYFTDKHRTPWGKAVNYDDLYSELARQMVLDNVRYWLELFHIDGLRLDAVHAIKDDSPLHILQEIALSVRNLAAGSRRRLVIAESDANQVRLISPLDQGGYGMDAQWMDDFHHSIHTALTGERQGYYQDYRGLTDLPKVYRNYLYTGQFSPYWGRDRGSDASALPGKRFVVALQNHDQVGNRARGERLAGLVPFSHLKAAAGLLFCSAYIPLIFMGEEYGEKNPFLFFTDYQDPKLQQQVSRGRREEFKAFDWNDVPDPQDPESFRRSKLTPRQCWQAENRHLFNLYQDLIKLRRSHPVLRELNKNDLTVQTDPVTGLVEITRRNGQLKLTILCNLGRQALPLPSSDTGRILLASSWPAYGGHQERVTDELAPGELVILETGSRRQISRA